MGTACKSLNFTTKKETLLIVFELNPTCLRAEINGESISGFGLIYVSYVNAKDGDEV